MLNLDDIQSAYVFAAARQLDAAVAFCKPVTTEYGERRRFALAIGRPTFAALRWLNDERFGASAQIGEAIDEFERQAEALAALPTSERITMASPIVCPACGGELTKPRGGEHYCELCLGVIMEPKGKLEWLFGIWMI